MSLRTNLKHELQRRLVEPIFAPVIIKSYAGWCASYYAAYQEFQDEENGSCIVSLHFLIQLQKANCLILFDSLTSILIHKHFLRTESSGIITISQLNSEYLQRTFPSVINTKAHV